MVRPPQAQEGGGGAFTQPLNSGKVRDSDPKRAWEQDGGGEEMASRVCNVLLLCRGAQRWGWVAGWCSQFHAFDWCRQIGTPPPILSSKGDWVVLVVYPDSKGLQMGNGITVQYILIGALTIASFFFVKLCHSTPLVHPTHSRSGVVDWIISVGSIWLQVWVLLLLRAGSCLQCNRHGQRTRGQTLRPRREFQCSTTRQWIHSTVWRGFWVCSGLGMSA